MTMSEASPQPAWRQMELPLTSSAAAFPASPTASQDSATVAPTTATSGPSSPGSFARLDPDGCWRKTCQGYCQLNLDGSLEEYCETWPHSGTVSNGIASALPTWGHRTSASASGLWGTPLGVNRSRKPETMEKCLSFRQKSGRISVPLYLEEQVRMWPTPRANENDQGPANRERILAAGSSNRGQGRGATLTTMAKLWPTPRAIDGPKGSRNPTPAAFRNVEKRGGNLSEAVQVWPAPAARDYRHPNALPYSEHGGGTKGKQLPNAVGGALNPTWVEWLMGLPLNWTSLDE